MIRSASLLAVVATGLTAACVVPGTVRAAPAVEGDLTIWAMGTEGDNLGVLADAFNEEFPDVNVEVTAVPWDAAHDRLITAIAGGEGPDVTLVGTTWMGEFAALDGLEPTPDSIDSKRFFEGAWDSTVVDGTSYGVPWYVETRALYYRTDLAAAGGVDAAPTTWDELTALATATQAGGAEYGISLQPGGIGAWQTWVPMFWQAGGEFMDGDEFTVDSPACVASVEYYQSFFEAGLAQDHVSDVPVEAQFAEGSVGAFVSGPWMISVITDAGADPETWSLGGQPQQGSDAAAWGGTASTPVGSAAASSDTSAFGTSFVGGGNLGVLSGSENKDAAWAFVEFASRPEVQVTWYETVSALPSVMTAWDDPALAQDTNLAVFGEQLNNAKSPPAIATWEEVASALDGSIEKAVIGGASAADTCADMQEQAESIGTGL